MSRIYEKLENRWIEISHSELRSRYRNMSFPREFNSTVLSAIPDNPYKILQTSQPPEYNPNLQQAVEIQPELVGDDLVQRWALEDLPKQLLQCTKVQAIAALSHAGLLAEFQEFIRNADPLTQALWESSYLLQSDSPTLLAVWAGLGKSEEELYALFQAAVEIKV